MSKDNLIPIQPGQKGKQHPASKPARTRLQKIISLRVKTSEYNKLATAAEQDGLSVGKYVRKQLGLD